ncbi:MAG: 2-amino-4-hydroxy-6-hydroxymethyldihydropteridine diphosphokinase [Planctomycetaceae bacterium]|nr:2-amino-4-hydroxy-6-hydroxymethyldihydropteridine diphosphokinase [Planctomycetaceae bacterium]
MLFLALLRTDRAEQPTAVRCKPKVISRLFLRAWTSSCSVFDRKNIKIELTYDRGISYLSMLSIMAIPQKSLLSLGSNLGNRKKNLGDAVAKIQQLPGVLSVRVSRFRESKPVGGPQGQQTFFNAAAEILTLLPVETLLAEMQKIEAELGRKRQARWDARTIDIDILTFDDMIISSPELVLPHPRMALRRFVLEPVCDLAGQQLHPETGWMYQRHLDHLRLAGNYALMINLTDIGPHDCLASLAHSEAVLLAPPLPIAQTEVELADNFNALKQWGAQQQFVLCNYSPRESLLHHPEWLTTIEKLEKSVLTPRLLVILTDNIHNESRHQWLTKIMPNDIVTPWLFLDNFKKDTLIQELLALTTCHL